MAGAPVYSTRFITTGAGSGYWRYWVPAGRRAVVRYVTVMNFGAAGDMGALIVANTIVWRAYPGSLQTMDRDMRVVAVAGEAIEWYSSTVNLFATVSGYLFQDTPGVGSLEVQVQRSKTGQLELIEGQLRDAAVAEASE